MGRLGEAIGRHRGVPMGRIEEAIGRHRVPMG